MKPIFSEKNQGHKICMIFFHVCIIPSGVDHKLHRKYIPGSTTTIRISISIHIAKLI